MTNRILVGYNLDLWSRQALRLPISVPYLTNIHWLICGNSGSGKSYFVLYLLRNLLQCLSDRIVLWFCDFKSSDDFSFLSEYARYYAGTDCKRGLEEFYAEFEAVKSGSLKDDKIRLLFFDEWAGFQVWETSRDKKQAELHRGILLEILLMGRSMRCGVTVIMQRNDAAYIQGREQFFVTVVFGKMSAEMKRMIMGGEELDQKSVYQPGEGIIKSDSEGTRFLKVPRLRDPGKVKTQILEALIGKCHRSGDFT